VSLKNREEALTVRFDWFGLMVNVVAIGYAQTPLNGRKTAHRHTVGFNI
jgi:hypothetical protein